MRHLKQTIAPNKRAANAPRATPASLVLPAKAKAAAQEAATGSGKRLYITKKTLQAARDAKGGGMNRTRETTETTGTMPQLNGEPMRSGFVPSVASVTSVPSNQP